jgi:mannose/fructose/N-acetylgalactosamine-specific phosphotransferase system component IIC
MSALDGMQFTLTNLFQFLSFITPFLLGFFLVLSSIFNQDLKGFIYLAGVLIATIINILLLNIIRSESKPSRSPICDLVNFNIFNIGGTFDNPSLSISFIAFTMVYLLLPMIYNKQMNWIVLVFLFLLYFVDAFTSVTNECTQIPGIFVGTITGVILGSLWYSIINVTGNAKLLYFDEFISNNVICSRPSKQTFKCAVYKNGELIKNNIV